MQFLVTPDLDGQEWTDSHPCYNLEASFCKLFIIKLWRYGDSNPDLLIANETLYQLSYTPNFIDFSELHGDLRS